MQIESQHCALEVLHGTKFKLCPHRGTDGLAQQVDCSSAPTASNSEHLVQGGGRSQRLSCTISRTELAIEDFRGKARDIPDPGYEAFMVY